MYAQTLCFQTRHIVNVKDRLDSRHSRSLVNQKRGGRGGGWGAGGAHEAYRGRLIASCDVCSYIESFCQAIGGLICILLEGICCGEQAPLKQHNQAEHEVQ